MKILIADKFPASHAKLLEARGHDLSLDPGLEGPTLPSEIAGHEVLIVRSTQVSPEAIDEAVEAQIAAERDECAASGA